MLGISRNFGPHPLTVIGAELAKRNSQIEVKGQNLEHPKDETLLFSENKREKAKS